MSQERLIGNLKELEQVAAETLDFISGLTHEAFLADVMVQRAIGMNLLMIGEVVVRLFETDPDFLAEHPEIAWQKIRGMGDRIAHNYLRTDLDTIWNTATMAVPELYDRLLEMRNIRPQGE
ncbi:DUF86 domain-containing protein [Agrobacterium sp. a22-2]|uniref:HepT-like ribonuclease domain-containing protein n=1 Tax=Agrobacterium sp. a22-2 TaxID=2283840 RepID=UPI001445C5F8|nr:HepT-like ribonuclease domain-containing protein [Agrobacterium sp. a22-2]NKN35780.1 DUF86 domain-containing protein [Agrobacterium sp. a22-2]